MSLLLTSCSHETDIIYKDKFCEVIRFYNKSKKDLEATPLPILQEIRKFEALCRQK